MKYVLLVICLLANVWAQAQIKFESGYFVDSNGKRVDCYIQDKEWRNNPTEIKYKLSPEGDVLTALLNELTEFSAGNNRYLKAKVQMDNSSQNMKYLTDSRAPEWVEKDVLLEVIIDSKADLFYYGDEERVLFFFRIDNSPIEQLVFKYYLTKADKTIKTLDTYNTRGQDMLSANTNLTYINQLNTQLSCSGMSAVTHKTMEYKRSDLTRYFIDYNQCEGSTVINYDQGFKTKTNFSIRPGIDFSSVFTSRNSPFDSRTEKRRFRLGVEAEFNLPYKKGKWALLIEPTFHSFEIDGLSALDFRSIEIPLGIRHYFFLGSKSRVFVNGAIEIDKPLLSEIAIPNRVFVGSKLPRMGWAAGVGFKYGKFSIEGRYHALRTYFEDETAGFLFDLEKSSVVLGYQFW